MTTEEAIKILEKYRQESEEDYYVIREQALAIAIKALKDQKEGHWITDSLSEYWSVCSECKDLSLDRTSYCPSCGAKMEN